MSDLAITAATALLGADTASGDLFPVVDVSAATPKGRSITRDELGTAMVATSALTTALDAKTISTPHVLHVTTAGSDTTGDGSMEKPFATGQKAYDEAESLYLASATTARIHLQFGVGTWNIALSSSGWWSKLTVGGVSAQASKLTINHSNGGAIHWLASDKRIFLSIVSIGNTGSGLDGGDCPQCSLSHVVGEVSFTGGNGQAGDDAVDDGLGTPLDGGSGGNGGSGGTLDAFDCYLYSVSLIAGGGSPGGAGVNGGLDGPTGNDGAGGVANFAHCYVRYISDMESYSYGCSTILNAVGTITNDFGGNATGPDLMPFTP